MNEQQARDYLGGSGLGIRLAHDEIPPEQAVFPDRAGDGDDSGHGWKVPGGVQGSTNGAAV